MQTDEVVWKPIVIGFTRFEVSNTGLVRSTGAKQREYKARCAKPGAPTVQLPLRTMRGQREVVTRSLPRLVASVFVPNPLGLPVLAHKDGDKHNCAASNLRWENYKNKTEEERAWDRAQRSGAVIVEGSPEWDEMVGAGTEIKVKPVQEKEKELCFAEQVAIEADKRRMQAEFDAMNETKQRSYFQFGNKPPEWLRLKFEWVPDEGGNDVNADDIIKRS